MGNMAFSSTLNARLGKRQRLAVSGESQFDSANYTIDATEKNAKREAKGAVLQITGSDGIYWTIDGTSPSSTVGFANAAGDYIYLDSFQKIKEFRAVESGVATSIEAAFLFGN